MKNIIYVTDVHNYMNSNQASIIIDVIYSIFLLTYVVLVRMKTNGINI